MPLLGCAAGAILSPTATRRRRRRVATPLQGHPPHATPTPRTSHGAPRNSEPSPKTSLYSPPAEAANSVTGWCSSDSSGQSVSLRSGSNVRGLAPLRPKCERGAEADEQFAAERPDVHVKLVIEPKLRHLQPGQAPRPPFGLFLHAWSIIRSSPMPGITRRGEPPN